jgi:hypothetical protein
MEKEIFIMSNNIQSLTLEENEMEENPDKVKLLSMIGKVIYDIFVVLIFVIVFFLLFLGFC